MKVSLSWLKEFVDFQLPPEETADLLRRLGFDVASIARFGGAVENVVSARVETAGKHPNADRLSLCEVFDGKDRWKVVCGAPNVAAGQTVPLARVGAKLPGGQTIQKASIRGQESFGMICSERELGLSENHSGILVLPEEVALGEDIGAVLDLGDAVLDVEVTPNRPDALSHWGLARELAAALKKPLRLPDMKIPQTKDVSHRVRIEEAELCSRYIGRVIRSVRVAPSPLRVRLRLERCGMRAINNVVDVTNYVLLELGHPLHAFDLARLAEGRVVVRSARPGETLACLDGVTRSLGKALVIADAEKPAAVAGIIGGAPSAVSGSTTDLLLESAHFHPGVVRQARKALNVATESSYRFERGTDPEVAEWASRRATRLLMDTAGGQPAEEQDAGKKPSGAPAISVEPERIEALLGMNVPPQDMKSSLERLGFRVSGSSHWTVTPPVHRHDVREEPDVAEEIARVTGYDRLPARLRRSDQMPDALPPEKRLTVLCGESLRALGFFEALNTGLLSKHQAERFAGTGHVVELANPLSAAGDALPPSLIPGLLTNLQTNVRHGNADPRLYEAARVFRKGSEGPLENTSLAWVAAGATHGDHWKHKPRALDIWDAKAVAASLFDSLGIQDVRLEPAPEAPACFHPSESLCLLAGGTALGFVGRLHPRLVTEGELPADTFLGEIDLSALALRKSGPVRYRGLPKHPALLRDFSVVFPASVTWSAVVERLTRKFDRVEHAELFDIFTDPSLPPDHRSLAFRLTFRHPDRTLTDAEAGVIQKAILADLEKEFQAQLRSVPLRPNQ